MVQPSNIFGDRLSKANQYEIRTDRIADRIAEELTHNDLSPEMIRDVILSNVGKTHYQAVVEDLTQRTFTAKQEGHLKVALSLIHPGDVPSRARNISGAITPSAQAARETILDIPQDVLTAIEAYLNPPPDSKPSLDAFMALLPPSSVRSDKRGEAVEQSRRILNYVKSYDLKNIREGNRESLKESTYALRTLCLQRSGSLMHSFEAYTYSVNQDIFKNPFSGPSVEYASSSAHYIPERQRDHLRALQNGFVEMVGMSTRFNDEERTIYVLGGNTAVGKTYCASHDPVFERGLLDGEAKGSINPDTIKAALRKDVPGVTNQQIHVEGAARCRQLATELKSKAIRSAMVLDERFAHAHELDNLVVIAKETGGIIRYKDIDGDLRVSCLRTLSRDISSDPCVPFGPISSGYKMLRQNRKARFEVAAQSPEVRDYELHVGDHRGITTLAAKKRSDGRMEILRKDLMDQAMTEPTDDVIREIESQVIDDQLIEEARQITGVKIRHLEAYRGMTIGQALLEHSQRIEPIV